MKRDKEDTGDRPVVLDAMMRFGGYGYRRCDIKDLSMHGVYVLASDGSLTRLTKNESVELALKLRANGKVKTHVFQAQVRSVDRRGAGLSFSDADVDAYSALLHLTFRS
ncbi:MAG TPA: PilZ domain-containing protein [Acidiferrobacterales bacterium]